MAVGLSNHFRFVSHTRPCLGSQLPCRRSDLGSSLGHSYGIRRFSANHKVVCKASGGGGGGFGGGGDPETSSASVSSSTSKPAVNQEVLRRIESEVPAWERGSSQKADGENDDGLPWPLYLLASCIVTIAATGSIFEYGFRNPIFNIVQPDSPLWAPILGWFVFTGYPLAVYLWMKGIAGANEAADRTDEMDGY